MGYNEIQINFDPCCSGCNDVHECRHVHVHVGEWNTVHQNGPLVVQQSVSSYVQRLQNTKIDFSQHSTFIHVPENLGCPTICHHCEIPLINA